MNGPYQIEEQENPNGEMLYVVFGPTLHHFRPRTYTDADMLRGTLNAAYAAGRADADKGLREAATNAVNDASGRSGGSVYMIHKEQFVALRAALAATEPAFAKQLRESVAQLENKP